MLRVITILWLAVAGSFAVAQGTDPQNTSAPKALPISETCPRPLPEPDDGSWTWTPQEHWAWDQICRGLPADLRAFPGAISKTCRPDGNLGDSVADYRARQLRSEFLHLIVNTPPWSGTLARPYLHILCAEFSNNVDLSNQQIDAEVRIEQSIFAAGVSVRGTRFSRDLSVAGSVINGTLNADGVRVGGDVRLVEGVRLADVSMSRAKISGDLFIEDVEVDGAVCARRIEIAGALSVNRGTFRNAVDLEDASVSGDYRIEDSDFMASHNTRDLSVGGNLELVSSRFLPRIGVVNDLARDAKPRLARCESERDADSSSEFAHLQLNGAQIGGDFLVSETEFAEGFDAPDMIVQGDVTLEEVELLANEINVSSARIDGDFAMIQPTLAVDRDGRAAIELHADGLVVRGNINIASGEIDSLWMPRIRVGGSFRIEGGSVISRHVWLKGSEIGRSLEIRHASLTAPLEADDLSLGKDLVIEGLSLGPTSFRNARIAGSASLIGGVRVLKASSSEQDDKSELGDVSFELAEIGGDLHIGHDAGTRAELGSFNFSRADIAGDVVLARTRIGSLDGSGSTVGGAIDLHGIAARDINLQNARHNSLVLMRYVDPSNLNEPDWCSGWRGVSGDGSTYTQQASARLDPARIPKIVLKNAQSQSLDATLASWRCEDQWISADLTGYRYAIVRSDAIGLTKTMSAADSDELVGWLEGVERRNAGDSFRTEPYDVLAAALRSAGQPEKANDVIYAKYVERDNRTLESTNAFIASVWRPLVRWAFGYGIYPYRVLWPIAGGVFIGMMLALFSRQQALQFNLARSLFYSIDKALPFVELSERHKEMELGYRWMTGYFVVLRIFGFVLLAVTTGTLPFLDI